MLTWLCGPILAAKADRLGTYAAALAYGLVLSLIPFLIMTYMLGTDLTHANLTWSYSELLSDILPDSGPGGEVASKTKAAVKPTDAQSRKLERDARVQRIIKTLQSSTHRHWTLLSFILIAYASYNLMSQIVRTLLFIFDDPRKPQGWNWTLFSKTLALFATWFVVFLLFAFCSMATFIHGPFLKSAHLNPAVWGRPLGWVRDLIGMAAIFGAFFMTYLLVPTRRHSLSQIRNGSLVAASGWALCSWLFAHVLPAIWESNVVFEALGSMVVILLWAQVCAWFVIIGACWMVRFPAKGKKRPRSTRRQVVPAENQQDG